ncbi:MAG: outer membrane protein assembly factor BamD [Planctomycetota bacterium]|nr:MAG: outer membrane protein assembly factor BamD [Planctomycetota bacterium]
MTRTDFHFLASLALLLTGACSSPPPEPYSSADLAPVHELARQGQWDEAWSRIDDMKREYFDPLAQGEYSLLAGDIAYQRGDWDEAIQNYELYLQFQGPAAQSSVVEARLFEMGLELIEGRRRAFGIFSDRSRGAASLTNLAIYSPRGRYAAEALAQVGEFHYENHYYQEAREDYQLLLVYHRDSEWADLATFRIGMCGYHQVDGPWVDAGLIQQSMNQLKEYLKQFPSGLYLQEAEQTVAELEELSAQKELQLGDYYRTVGNVRGARQHYREASTHSGTRAAELAQARLQGLPPEDPPLPEPVLEDA